MHDDDQGRNGEPLSLVRVRIGVRVGWAEQQAFAEIHRHMSMPVITMMTSVAEKISGVRNEL